MKCDLITSLKLVTCVLAGPYRSSQCCLCPVSIPGQAWEFKNFDLHIFNMEVRNFVTLDFNLIFFHSAEIWEFSPLRILFSILSTWKVGI